MSKIYDISPRLSSDIAVWPGDTPYSRKVLLDVEKGDNLTLSGITTTVHVGAHTDAPNHYGKGEPGISDVALDPYLGPCDVVKVTVARGERILLRDLGDWTPQSERVLFRTETFPNPNHFNEDFASLSVELIDHLAEKGVKLVGLDTPSVDPCSSKDLPAHKAILKHKMAILEGVVLAEVPNGTYELIALPLPLKGADASPVRAILRSV